MGGNANVAAQQGVEREGTACRASADQVHRGREAGGGGGGARGGGGGGVGLSAQKGVKEKKRGGVVRTS